LTKANKTTRKRSNNKITRNQKTFNGFIRNWLSDSWDHKTNIEKRAITYDELVEFLVYKSKKIILPGNITLDNILSTKPTFKSNMYLARQLTKQNRYMIALGRIDDLSCIENYNDDYYQITIQQIKASEPIKYLCKKDKFDIAINGNTVKTPPFIVAGLIYYEAWGKPLKMMDIAIVPISDNGVFVESSYERQYYNKAHQENRAFIKPYNIKIYSSFKGRKPDAIFIDTGEKNTIVEIFGRSEGDELYHARKEDKIKHFSQLSNYNFECWYAYKGEPLPSLPEQK